MLKWHVRSTSCFVRGVLNLYLEIIFEGISFWCTRRAQERGIRRYKMRDLAALLDCLAASDCLGLGCSFGSSDCSSLRLAQYDFGGLHLTSASDAGAAIISTANPPDQSCSCRIHTCSREFDDFGRSGCMTIGILIFQYAPSQ